MTQEQLDKLFEYIDMKFKEFDAKDSSDGGLIELMQVNQIKQELINLVVQ